MGAYSINDTKHNNDSHKLFYLLTEQDKISENIKLIQSQKINVINVGKEIAHYINNLKDFSHLYIDVYDYLYKLFDKHRVFIVNSKNTVIAIYNIGILLEPSLMFNVVKFLKEYSKNTSVIIIWDNLIDNQNKLMWHTHQSKFSLDFSEINLKKLHNVI